MTDSKFIFPLESIQISYYDEVDKYSVTKHDVTGTTNRVVDAGDLLDALRVLLQDDGVWREDKGWTLVEDAEPDVQDNPLEDGNDVDELDNLRLQVDALRARIAALEARMPYAPFEQTSPPYTPWAPTPYPWTTTISGTADGEIIYKGGDDE